MSIERFCQNLDKEITALKVERETKHGQEKGHLTRKITAMEYAMKKALRKGVQE